MAIWQALLFALLQGVTELFPVSSLGHAVIIPNLLNWSFRTSSAEFVPFLVLLHLGTAAALLFLYRDDWPGIIAGFFRAAARGRIRGDSERLAYLIVVGSVPAGIIGFLLEKPLKALFANPRAAAAFLIVNGGLLLGAEFLRRGSERRAIATAGSLRGDAGNAHHDLESQFAEVSQLTFRQAFVVGIFQALALLPGISRSGVTMGGGLLAGLRHEEAARFSFLLATPIILAAGVLEVPQLFDHPAPLGVFAAAAVVAGLAAYGSARFLLRYFRFGRLDPYAYYCAALGVLALLLLR